VKGGGGFSLLELLLVLAIASVLMCIALPGYREVAIRAHRVAGKVALMDVVARQERHLLNHKRYGASLDELGLGPNYYIGPTAEMVSEESAVYRVELALEDGVFSGVRAVPWNSQRRDTDCGTFTLDRRGSRGVLGSHAGQPDRCW
jgi:type IV pilus assembly protein PilE